MRLLYLTLSRTGFLALLAGFVLGSVSGHAADPVSDTLSPRAEVSVKGGSERSVLTTEFWAPLAQQSGKVLYGDLRLMGDNDDNREGNLGFGYRQIVESTDSVIGGHLWIDRRRTEHNSTFHQLTFGLESLGNSIDLRWNGYIPLNGANTATTPNLGTTTPYLAGSGIFYDTNGSVSETPQYGTDAEIGYRLPILKKQFDTLRIYGGGYSFFRSNTDSVNGYRVRTEAVINSIFSVGARFQHDAPRGDQGFLEATIRFPFSAKKLYQSKGLYGRLDESPERDVDIVTSSKATSGLGQPLLNASGTQQRILYVDNTVTNGDGTKEHPFNNLTSAQTALQANDILYIAAGNGTSSGMNQGITITQNNVTLIGSGSALTIGGYTFLNAGAAPIISNTQAFVDDGTSTGNGYTGNGIYVNADNISISGVTVRDTNAQGIYVLAQNGQHFSNVDIHNVTLTNNAGAGMAVLSRLGATIDNISIQNNTSDNNRFYGIVTTANAAGHIGNTLIQNNSVNGQGSFGIIMTSDNANSTVGTLTVKNNTANGNGNTNIEILARVGGHYDTVNVLNNTSTAAQAGSNIDVSATGNTSSSIGAINIIGNTALNGVYGIGAGSDKNARIGSILFDSNISNNNSQVGIISTAYVTTQVDSITFSNNTTINNASNGIFLNVLSSGTFVNNVTVTGNRTDNNNGNGIQISSGSNGVINNVNINNGTANNNKISGINVTDSGNATIGNVSVTNMVTNNNTQYGTIINPSGGLIGNTNLSSITANGNTLHGVHVLVNGSGTLTNLNATNITANNNLQRGVYVLAGTGTIGTMTLDGITTTGNVSDGVRVQSNSAGSVITSATVKNVISTGNFYGVLATASSSGVITTLNLSNITIGNSGGQGLYAQANGGTMSNIILSNVTSNNNAQQGIVLQTISSGIIGSITASSVTTNNNVNSGFQLDSSSGSINSASLSGITATGNTQTGIYITASGTANLNNVNLNNSNATGNAQYGLYVLKGTSGAFLVDAGGGALGSVGQNRIFGNTANDLRIDGGYALKAQLNWWGVNSTPTRVTLNNGSTVDSTAFLATDPRP